jgi:aromatic-L-amino-acid/L-tryptophan decarboxylase
MMDWAAQLLGLNPVFLNKSKTGGGVIMVRPALKTLTFSLDSVLQPTASESGLTAIVAARSLYTRQHPDVPVHDLLIYVSSQTHSLGAKAASILGLSLRTLDVSAEDNFSLRGATLRAALEEDEAQGRRPFVISWFDPCLTYASLTHQN